MKKIKSISVFLGIFIIAGVVLVYGIKGEAMGASASMEGRDQESPAASGTPTRELVGSYTMRFLVANAKTPVETITFKKDPTDPTGVISATMVCAEYGKQEIPVVYFDGDVVKFIALAGSNHDENFYYELKYYGTFLIGEAEGGRGPIPVIAKDAKDTIYW